MLNSIALVLGVSLVITALPAAAAESEKNPDAGLTIYSAQGIDTNLPDFAGRVVNGTLEFDDTRFTGVSYTIGTPTPRLIERVFELIRVHDMSTGVELLGVKHSGLQDHFESSMAYRLNTPYLELGPLETRLGYSLGLSYAFGAPMYERSPDDDRERLLTYMAYEWELKLEDYERLSVVTRIHHRSGAYGLFAPRGSGSNFLAVGLRMHW